MEAIVFWIDVTLTVQFFLKLGSTISKFCEGYTESVVFERAAVMLGVKHRDSSKIHWT